MPARGGLRRWVSVGRSLLLALALAAPVFCMAQASGTRQSGGSTTPTSQTPVTSAPAAGLPAGEVPGAALPGALMPIPGLTGAAATGLGPAPAEYASYGAAAGIGVTDNVNLSASGGKSQTLAAANVFFDLIHTASRLELSALGNFSDINYLEHAYTNQLLGRFDGIANLKLWPHHLKWLVRDDYGDQQTNVLQAFTPANLQRVNIFSTGPDLTLQPTLTSYIELQGLYSRMSYQDSPFDGQIATGSFTAGHDLSESSSISLVGQVQQLKFDNTIVNRNYQIREYYARYRLRGARTAIDLQGGMAQSDDTGSWKSTPLVRLSLTRNVSPFSTVSLAGGREYTNDMANFASLSSTVSGGIPIGAGTQTTGSALRTYGNASWGFHRARTTLDLIGAWAREAYDRQPIYDVDRANIGMTVGRKLNPLLSAYITATVDRQRYVNQGFTDNFGTASGGIVYRPGAWVVIYGRYDHQFRRTSGEPAKGLGYDENRIFLMIGYYPHSSGTETPGEPGGGGLMSTPMP